MTQTDYKKAAQKLRAMREKFFEEEQRRAREYPGYLKNHFAPIYGIMRMFPKP